MVLGFRTSGFRFRVQGSGFRVRVQGLWGDRGGGGGSGRRRMGGTVGVATQLAYARQRAGVEEASWTLRSCQKNQGGGGQWKGSHSHSN
jgi:hypothetical protein